MSALRVGQRSIACQLANLPVWTIKPAREQARSFANDDALEASKASDVPLDPNDKRVREITVPKGIGFPGDLRSTSGLGLGDGLTSHTSKWQQVIGFSITEIFWAAAPK